MIVPTRIWRVPTRQSNKKVLFWNCNCCIFQFIQEVPSSIEATNTKFAAIMMINTEAVRSKKEYDIHIKVILSLNIH